MIAVNEQTMVMMGDRIQGGGRVLYGGGIFVTEEVLQVRNRLSAERVGEQHTGPIPNMRRTIVTCREPKSERLVPNPRVRNSVENQCAAALPFPCRRISVGQEWY